MKRAFNRERGLRQRILGRFLRAAREEVGLTQLDLASRLSYSSAQFISNWERGLSVPPLNVLPRLSTILEIPPKALLETLHEYQRELLMLQRKQLLEVFRKKFPGRC